MESGREMRRTTSTASNHTTFPSNHRIRDRDEEAVATGLASRSASIGASERRESFASRSGGGASSSRTLMDIIQEEHAMRRGEFPGATANGGINWRSFKERLGSRKEASGSESDAGGHELDIGLPTSPVFGRSTTLRLNQLRSRSEREEIVSDYNYPAAAVAREEVQQPPPPPPATVSLMSLLADGDDEEEEEEEEGGDSGEEEGEEEEMYCVCCVCMVRHKGAAFIPCGHTFCRLCSRELWVSRGNCPLCNGYILEILDIF